MGLGKPSNRWKMQDTTNGVVDSIGGYGGAATSGNYRTFNGTSDYVTLNNPIIPIGAKTIKFKFRKNGNPTANGYIFDNSGNTNGLLASLQTNGVINFQVIVGGNTKGTVTTGSVSVCDNKWHEITLSWDGTTNANTLKVFVDDMVTPISQNTVSQIPTTTAQNLVLGKHVTNTNSFAGFDIDDLWISNGVNGTGTVVAWWKMDDTAATAMVDSSSNNWTPTITGTTVSTASMGPLPLQDAGGETFRRFNGRSDRITFTNQVLPLGAKSIRFKVRTTSTNVAQTIFDQITGNSANNGTYVFINNGQVYFRSAGNATWRFNVYSTKKVNDGLWHEVLLIWGGTTAANGVKIFIDDMGTPDVQGTALSTETSNATSSLVVGARYDLAAGNFFEGDLKDITIYAGVGNERTKIEDMQIGDFISARYSATSNALGGFSELGATQADFIKPASSPTPDGAFYYVYVCDDHLGRKMLVSDRVVQHSISWDTLNTEGVAHGSGLPLSGDGWVTADNDTSLNYDGTKNTYAPAPFEFNRELYITWHENNGHNQIRVKKFDGANWVTADNNASLNYNTSLDASYPVPFEFNRELYITWHENNGSGIQQIRVKKWNGTSWVTADNNASLNYDGTKNGNYPTPIVFNNELYITWQESNGSSTQQIRVKKFDGANWVTADNNASLNYDGTKNASYPVPIVFNSQLYITWHESNGSYQQIRLKKWDGANWVTADNNTSLNYNTAQSAYAPVPVVFNSQLYITWYESNGSYYQIRVKKFDGTNWVTADNNASLNYVVTQHATAPTPVIFNNRLHITWQENNGAVYQIRVKKFDGANWVTADNSTSLNYKTSQHAYNPTPIVFNSGLYITWYEFNGSYNQIRVRKAGKWYDDKNWLYTARLLTGGIDASDKNNEWDSIIASSNLNATVNPGENAFWYWNGKYSWTSTVATASSANRTFRGNTGVSTYSQGASNQSLTTNGFRPVLLVDKAVSSNSAPTSSDANLSLTVTHGQDIGIGGTITDVENQQVQYRIFVNSTQVYPESGFTALAPSPLTVNYLISNSLFNIGDNTVRLEFMDEKGASDAWQGTVNITNDIPTATVTLSPTQLHKEDVKVTATITDTQDNISYRILLNGTVLADWTPFTGSPLTVDYTIANNLLTYGDNSITVEYKDDFKTGGLGTYAGTVTVVDSAPTATITLSSKLHKDSAVVGISLDDLDRDKVSYRVLLNGKVFADWSPFAAVPFTDSISIPNTSLDFGSNTIRVEYKEDFRTALSGYWEGTTSVENALPTITSAFLGLTLNSKIEDIDGDKVQYRILLNGVQKYPDAGFTELLPTPLDINKTFTSEEIMITANATAPNNTITVEYKDEYGTLNTWSQSFIGDYAGLMFVDDAGNYYSTDKGVSLKELEFGTIVAGQTSDVKYVFVKNKNGFKVTDVWLNVDRNTLPANTYAQLSRTEAPFNPESLLKFSELLAYGEQVRVFVRIAVDMAAVPSNGKFNIFVKGTPTE